MTTKYSVTKGINKGKQLYVCMSCGRVWTSETKNDPIDYKIPSWIIDNHYLSHGLCCDDWTEYVKNRIRKREGDFWSPIS